MPPSESPELLIQCIGDPLRGDDGAGPAVAQRLRSADLPTGIRVREHWGEGTALMQEWAGAEHIVLVDAACSGAEPGTIHRFDAANQTIPADFCYYTTHRFGVAEAVEMARALGRLPARLQLLAIEGRDFRLGAPPTPAVAAAVQRVTADLLGLARGPTA
jgi:hydrogenase maturation protease